MSSAYPPVAESRPLPSFFFAETRTSRCESSKNAITLGRSLDCSGCWRNYWQSSRVTAPAGHQSFTGAVKSPVDVENQPPKAAADG